jgi:integrase
MPKYAHGKQTKSLTQEEYLTIMDQGHFMQARHKAFVALLYYTGSRKAEILELTPEACDVGPDALIVRVKAKKHGVERGAYILRRDLPYVNDIVAAVEKTRPGKRIFPFTGATAWNIVKRILPGHYPHYFRLNRCVAFLDKPDVTQDEVRQWFGWKSLRTVDHYLGYSERTTGKLSEKLE